MSHEPKRTPEVQALLARRNFIRTAAVGTAIVAFGGGAYVLADDDPRKNLKRPDGRPRLPPGQRILSALKPMGGDPGDANPAAGTHFVAIMGDGSARAATRTVDERFIVNPLH